MSGKKIDFGVHKFGLMCVTEKLHGGYKKGEYWDRLLKTFDFSTLVKLKNTENSDFLTVSTEFSTILKTFNGCFQLSKKILVTVF